MRRISHWLFSIVIALTVGSLHNFGQSFLRLDVSDGLPSNHVQAITQDKMGFLWFGTNNGLSRYDGIRFQHFKHDWENRNTLSHNHIWDLLPTEEGMWIATDHGLTYFHAKTRQFRRFNHKPNDNTSISADPILSLCMDNEGTLWVGTSNGLNSLAKDSDKFRRYYHDPGNDTTISSNRILHLSLDREGVLWVGTGQGLVYHRGKGHFSPLGLPFPNSDSKEIRGFARDHEGTVWVASSKGLASLRPGRESLSIEPLPSELTEANISQLSLDRKGQLWLATDKGVLRIKSQHHQELFQKDTTNASSPPSNDVTRIFEDASGVVWFGSRDVGLFKLSRHSENFKTILPNNSNKSPNSHWVRAVLKDENSLYLGTDQGLEVYDLQTQMRQTYYHDENNPFSIGAGPVRSLFMDRNKTLWVGTSQGLSRRSAGRKRFTLLAPDETRPHETLSHSWVYDMFQDQDGEIWISTPRGLNRISPNDSRIRHYLYDTRRKSNHIWGIASAGPGALWLGSEDGLLYFNKGSRTFEHPPETPKNLWIYDLISNEDGGLWIATQGGGLIYYHNDPEKRRYWREEDGLISDAIHAMVLDQQGQLWLATPVGLSCFNPETGQFHSYRHEDGLPGSQFSRQAAIVDQQGHLYFGMSRGLTTFDPLALQQDRIKPTMTFTGLRLGNARVVSGPDSLIHRPMEFLDQIQFEHNHGIVTLEFAGLHFADPKQNRYAYQFEGVEEDWVYLEGATGEVTFANLSPGIYHFRLKGSNSDGTWSTNPKNLKIMVHPPWWQTAWAFSTVTSILLIGIVTYLRIQRRRLRREKALVAKLREEQAQRDHSQVPMLVPDEEEIVAISGGRVVPDQKEYTILIVDDDSVNRKVLSNHLNRPPYRVIEAGEGPEALGILRSEHVDLVLLDIMMPNMSGFEVCVELRKDFQMRDMPVIFLSARTQTDDLVTGLSVGGNDYLVKPVTRAALLARVKTHLELLSSVRALAAQARLLERADELEALSKLKTRFLANISHELRTPLALNLGPLQDLLTQRTGPLNHQQQSLVQVVHRNANRLLLLIEQLLELARLESGPVAIHARRIKIGDFIAARVNAFQPLAQREDIVFKTMGLDSPHHLYIDEEKFDKVLYNLFSNALKFTPAGGQILVTLDMPESQLEGGAASIQVRDTGVGIDAETMPHIFDRFYQGSEASQKQHSTGIGLSLVKEYITRHCGEVHASSTPGEGTTFTITLPLGRQHLADSEILRDAEGVKITQPILDWDEDLDLATQIQAPLQDDITLLVIEDNAELRAYMRQHFQTSYKVVEASEGEAGLRQAQEIMPDLIISDVMMPGLDGLEMLKRLREDPRTSHIPVILLTAKATQDDKLQGLREGADAYLTKPFNVHELELSIANQLEQRSRLKSRYEKALSLEPTKLPLPSADEAFLQRLKGVLEENMGDSDFGVAELAEEVGLSRRQLHRKLTAMLEQTPAEFMREIRIKRAVQMLRQQTGTISEIGYAVGFNSPSYFSRVFLKVMGVSPTVYLARLDAEPVG